MEFEDLSNRVIGCVIEVHREPGPGLLESACEQCHGSGNRIPGQLRHPQPARYKDIRLDCGYRVDVLVDKKLIPQLRSVEEIKRILKWASCSRT